MGGCGLGPPGPRTAPVGTAHGGGRRERRTPTRRGPGDGTSWPHPTGHRMGGLKDSWPRSLPTGQPSARTTGSAQPTGSTKPPPFSGLLGRCRLPGEVAASPAGVGLRCHRRADGRVPRRCGSRPAAVRIPRPRLAGTQARRALRTAHELTSRTTKGSVGEASLSALPPWLSDTEEDCGQGIDRPCLAMLRRRFAPLGLVWQDPGP
jgi:hypothetical protein